MLTPYQSFGALLSSSHFICTALFLVAATFGISYGITYSSVRSNPLLWVVFDTSEVINVTLTCFFLALVLFVVVLHMARKRIMLGVQPPLAHAAYKSNVVKRVLLHPLGLPDWRKRIVLILLQSFLFPAAFILGALALSCHFMKEAHKQHDDDDFWLPTIYSQYCLVPSLHGFLAIGSSYRAFMVFIIYLYVYISAYNDAQPELVELRAAAAASAISAAIGESAAMYRQSGGGGAEADAAGGGRQSYAGEHHIPTGTVLYAIPVEMTVIPSPGTTPAPSQINRTNTAQPPSSGGSPLRQSTAPPYVTNELGDYHGHEQHRGADAPSGYGYGYAHIPPRSVGIDFYPSDAVPSDRTHPQPKPAVEQQESPAPLPAPSPCAAAPLPQPTPFASQPPPPGAYAISAAQAGASEGAANNPTNDYASHYQPPPSAALSRHDAADGAFSPREDDGGDVGQGGAVMWGADAPAAHAAIAARFAADTHAIPVASPPHSVIPANRINSSGGALPAPAVLHVDAHARVEFEGETAHTATAGDFEAIDSAAMTSVAHSHLANGRGPANNGGGGHADVEVPNATAANPFGDDPY